MAGAVTSFQVKAQAASNPHLAIEALRALLMEEAEKATRHNLVRQRAFSERITEVMRKYTNQQLTSAEVIAELIEMAEEVAAEGNRGQHFTPPLSTDELAFDDAVSTNDSAVELQGEDVLAQIARDLISIMQRDVKTDWTVRDDVRAKLRSSIKRLLVKFGVLRRLRPTPGRSVDDEPSPQPSTMELRRWARPEVVPVFIVIRLIEEEPDSAPAA